MQRRRNRCETVTWKCLNNLDRNGEEMQLGTHHVERCGEEILHFQRRKEVSVFALPSTQIPKTPPTQKRRRNTRNSPNIEKKKNHVKKEANVYFFDADKTSPRRRRFHYIDVDCLAK